MLCYVNINRSAAYVCFCPTGLIDARPLCLKRPENTSVRRCTLLRDVGRSGTTRQRTKRVYVKQRRGLVITEKRGETLCFFIFPLTLDFLHRATPHSSYERTNERALKSV